MVTHPVFQSRRIFIVIRKKTASCPHLRTQDRDFSELNTFSQVGCQGKVELGSNSFRATAWPCWISGKETTEEMIEWISALGYHLKRFLPSLSWWPGFSNFRIYFLYFCVKRFDHLVVHLSQMACELADSLPYGFFFFLNPYYILYVELPGKNHMKPS